MRSVGTEFAAAIGVLARGSNALIAQLREVHESLESRVEESS